MYVRCCVGDWWCLPASPWVLTETVLHRRNTKKRIRMKRSRNQKFWLRRLPRRYLQMSRLEGRGKRMRRNNQSEVMPQKYKYVIFLRCIPK